jgi:hypothetical protein
MAGSCELSRYSRSVAQKLDVRVRELLEHPPPESGVAKALAYGVDLSLTVRNMFARTPSERLRGLQEGAASLAFLARRRSAR